MSSPSKQHIVVGISGGVDSSVAALLLKQQGHKVEGLFMKNWEEDDNDEYCAAAADLEDARAVCEALGIRLHTVNFSSEYWDRVFTYFLQEYRAGRTPNPDVMCNKEIKFKAFLDHAMTLGADSIATGHYARVARVKNKTQLLRGIDHNKDQTYFLHTLGQHQLKYAHFPVGGSNKAEVRKIAAQAGLVTHDKKDSTGICFIGERRFRDFLAHYLPAQPGDIVSPEGHVIGTHQGLMYHTIGQRQGLEIGGLKDMPEAAWYVVAKDMSTNRLIAAQGHDNSLLMHSGLIANQIHWINEEPLDTSTSYTAKIRYRQADQACTLTSLTQDRYQVNFAEPQRAITPGQSVVVYHGETCLGGGVIDQIVK